MLRRKKAFSRPKKPWAIARMGEESILVKEYGLKTKTEIWRASEILKKWREIAKKITVMTGERKENEAKILITKLQKYGIISAEADIDDVLALTLKDILEKRLQTVVYKKNMALTAKQARQFIVHNKVAVNKEKISSPSYLVKIADEVSFVPGFKPKLVQEKPVTVKPEEK
ncbi:MAG: 30S ribosomal protein S4 [archaeon]